jgi:Fe-S oxidoreductase
MNIMTKLIYLGCLSKKHYEKTCANAIRVINYLDEQYQVIDDAPCCGSLTFHYGNNEKTRNHIKYVNSWFQYHNIDKILTICAGCYQYLTRYYPVILGSEFNIKVEHIIQFIARPDNLKKLDLKYNGKKLKISYHDACHLKNAIQPVIEEPRTILNSIDKITLHAMENEKLYSICCGSGGGVYSIFKENNDFNTQTIFDQAKRAKILLTGCPFCYTAFKRVGAEINYKKTIMKFEDFIATIKFGNGGKTLE